MAAPSRPNVDLQAAGSAATGAPIPSVAQRLSSLSLVMPAHNEAENLPWMVQRCAEVLPAIAERQEVIIVDDGSSDGGGELALRVASAAGIELRVIRHARKSGYGISVADGLRAVKLDFAAFTDADGQFDVGDLALLVPYLDAADLVAGWRIERSDATARSVVSGVYNALVRLLYGLRVRDLNCAMKLMRTEFLRSVELEAHSAMINAELFWKARRGGWRIAQVGVPHHPRRAGVRSGARPRAILNAFRELVVFRVRLGRAAEKRSAR
jgi:glycosyltransferase involved in cell wall biosynthesis